MKYKAEIWYLEVLYDPDFDYSIKNFNQLAK